MHEPPGYELGDIDWLTAQCCGDEVGVAHGMADCMPLQHAYAVQVGLQVMVPDPQLHVELTGPYGHGAAPQGPVCHWPVPAPQQ